MHSAKTTNTTLALAISAVLATASSQATSVAPNHTSDSAMSNSSFLLASNDVTEQQSEAFWNSKYTYDDAELLAEYWGKPEPWYAKLKIGRLLINGDDAAIQKALQQARNNPAIQQVLQQRQQQAPAEQQQWDAYSNSKYSYDDAEFLAEYWGKPNISDAKLKIGRLLVSGDDAAIQKALQQARQQQQQQSEAFWNSKYTYDDAELLADYWGKPDPWYAKLKIGRFLVSGDEAAIKKALQQARNNPAIQQVLQQRQQQARTEQQQSEAFWNSKYTYHDAVLLAMYWGKPTWDAKLKIGSLLMSGDDAAIQKAVQQAKVVQQQWNAYSNSKYTYDDAVLLAEYWGKLEPWDAKLKIGSLLMSGDDAAIQKALQQAKPQR
jgi:ribosomal protein L16/L10AE